MSSYILKAVFSFIWVCLGGRFFYFFYFLQENDCIYVKQKQYSSVVSVHIQILMKMYFHLQNLLALNPKVTKYANLVSSTETKENKKHWKRNAAKGCSVSIKDGQLPEVIPVGRDSSGLSTLISVRNADIIF